MPIYAIDHNISKNIHSAGDFLRLSPASDGSVFVRLCGQYPQLLHDVAALDGSGGSYIRLGALPVLTPNDDAAFYAAAAENATSGADIRITSGDSPLSADLGRACSEALRAFRLVKGSNQSVERNFLAKLLFRLDRTFAQTPLRAGVKLVGENVTKIQEYLFFYVCALLGANVLLLQTGGDIDGTLSALTLSESFTVGSFAAVKLPEFTVRAAAPQAVQQTVSQNVQQAAPQSAAQSAPVRVTLPQRQRPASSRPTPPPVQAAPVQPAPARPPIHRPEIQRPENIHTQTIQRPQNIPFTPIQRPENISYTPISGNYSEQRRERSYEELATLASSVVQILVIRSASDILPSGEFRACSSGSGVMVGSDGYIVTNCHVARSGRIYAVRIENDNNVYFTDRLIKYHDKYDLALLRIDRKLTPLPVYSGLRPLARGQKVVAIGSPLGMFNSISDGIISGFRTVDEVEMIQFTAPISSGSSGGAVLNLYGDVIGISTAGIETDDGVAQNLNLAVGYKTIRSFCGNMLDG